MTSGDEQAADPVLTDDVLHAMWAGRDALARHLARERLVLAAVERMRPEPGRLLIVSGV